jgi:hypothetical protein
MSSERDYLPTEDWSFNKDTGKMHYTKGLVPKDYMRSISIGTLEECKAASMESLIKAEENAKKTISTGLKYDAEKPRMDLLDADFLEGVAEVLTFGAKKYAAHNWRGGISVSRLIASSYRHLGAINRGEDTDGESNLPHVYHLACCIMFLSDMLKNRPDLDDRYKGKTNE